jgi:hypothetical protein
MRALLHSQQDKFAQLFSYAAQRTDNTKPGADFVDDAIRIERWGKG